MKIFKTIKMKVALLALLGITIAGVGITYAYLKTQTSELKNNFTVGEITTEIEEDPKVEGSTIKKDPKVTNHGASDSIIRMRVSVSPKKIADYLATNKGINYDTNTWYYNETDGFWYYQGIVATNASTTSLFTEVTGLLDKDGKIIEEFKNVDNFEITLYQEAVQAKVWDKDGNALQAFDENGVYNQEKAMAIWKNYQGTK